MSRLIAATFAVVLLGSALPALADVDNLTHNGSRMRFEWSTDHARILYIEPRAGLASAGVDRGSLLFEGSISKDGQLDGTAFTFKRGCAPAPYHVSGAIEGTDIRLEGGSPKRQPGSCAVARLDEHGMHSMLLFEGLEPEIAAKATGRPWTPPRPDFAEDASPAWRAAVERYLGSAQPQRTSEATAVPDVPGARVH